MSQWYLNENDDRRQMVIDNMIEEVRGLDLAKPWVVDVKRYARHRTNEQNAALWGLAYKIVAEATGQSADDWHQYFLGERFGWIECNLFGKRKLRPARTTTTGFDGAACKMSTLEFFEYFNFVQSTAAEHGIKIPDPDPMWRAEMQKQIEQDREDLERIAKETP